MKKWLTRQWSKFFSKKGAGIEVPVFTEADVKVHTGRPVLWPPPPEMEPDIELPAEDSPAEFSLIEPTLQTYMKYDDVPFKAMQESEEKRDDTKEQDLAEGAD